LRDSAGFTPDFAASVPAGDYVPGAPSIAPTVVDGSARFALDEPSFACQSRAVKSCGPSGSQDLAFKEIDPLLLRGEVVR
jgi:hypothetical protein